MQTTDEHLSLLQTHSTATAGWKHSPDEMSGAHIRKHTEEELLETQEVIWLRIFSRQGLEM